MPQCGSIVLSQSKKLMMEAMHPVDEYVKYTDTDSMYITEKGLKILQKTKPELFGKELGQFKFEFKLEGEDIRIEAEFLAPKVYWTRERNEREEKHDKIVMKGIPPDSIQFVIDQKFDGDPKKLFKALRSGVLFDLTNGNSKIRMGQSFTNDIFNVEEFFRTLGPFL